MGSISNVLPLLVVAYRKLESKYLSARKSLSERQPEGFGCGGVWVICQSVHLHIVSVLLLNADLHLSGGLARSGRWWGDVMDCGAPASWEGAL